MGIKAGIKNLIVNAVDEHIRQRKRENEIKKFQDPRRVAIFSQVKLSQEQMSQIDDLYVNNYGKKIPYTWHRHYTAFTGNFDSYYFPELLFIPEFERYMIENRDFAYARTFSDKNILPLLAYAAGVVMPHTLFSSANGCICGEAQRSVTMDSLKTLKGEYFVKPTVGSCSGVGCQIVSLNKGVDERTGSSIQDILNLKGSNWVIQNRIVCHESIKNIYSGSVNTFRIMTYLWDGKILHAPVTMRIGRGGSYLDNAHAGGMFIALDDDGAMHRTAFTEFRNIFTEHPDTHVKFEGYKIPLLPKVIEAAVRCHSFIPQVGCVNWDFTLDSNGMPMLIEANMGASGIWIFQMAHGKGPFGDLTPDILQWLRVMNKTKKTERV